MLQRDCGLVGGENDPLRTHCHGDALALNVADDASCDERETGDDDDDDDHEDDDQHDDKIGAIGC